MTQVTETGASGTESQSAKDQAKEKVQETAQQVQQQVGEKAQEARGQAGERLRQQLDERSTTAGEQVSATANAMRRVGGQLREEGNETPARLAEQAAERAERLGRYLTEANADRILRDLEDFGRRQPWIAGIGGAVFGFLASRFVKASSSRRYEQTRGNGYAAPRSIETERALPAAGEAGEPAMAAFGEETFVAEPPGPAAGSIGGGTTSGQPNR